jgi:hypothetical protein
VCDGCLRHGVGAGLSNPPRFRRSAISFNRCSFYDFEAAGLLGINSAQLRNAKHELLRKGFLGELHSPGRKPTYGLRYGQPAVLEDGNEAA